MIDLVTTYLGGRLPFEIEDLKDYLGIEHEADDMKLQVISEAICELVEKHTNLGLVKQGLVYTFEYSGETIKLPRSPYIGTFVLKGIDQEGAETTLTLNTDYYLRGNSVKYLEILSTEYYLYKATYQTGYIDCPRGLIIAIWKQAAFNSQNRTGGELTKEVLNDLTPFIQYG